MFFTASVLCIVAVFVPADASMGLSFLRNPEPLSAPPGDEATFECSLNVPAEAIRWRQGTKFLTQGQPENNLTTRSSHLVVKVENSSQAGDYQCVASYGASKLVSIPARLTLAELHRFSNVSERRFDVSAGNTVSLHCEPPYSSPPAFVEYHKDGKKLPESVMTLPTTNSLILNNVKAKDSGVYSCTATNYITGQTVKLERLASLNIIQPGQKTEPRFLFTPKTNYSTLIDYNVTMECVAVGNPAPHITWRKYGGSLPEDRTEMIPGGLTIHHVRREDEGTYVCELYNGVGKTLMHIAMLFIHEPPVLVKEPKSPIIEEEGGEVDLECAFTGSPEPAITWQLNGDSLDNDTHVHAAGGKLRISQLEKRHAGIVQCFGSNILGTSYGATMLQVSPKQVTAQVPGDLIEDDINEDETEDRIDYFVTPEPIGRRGHHRRFNGLGRGKGRKKDRKHKGNAHMVPPTRPNVTRLTDNSVMVRWNVPSNNGLPIQFFKVQHREIQRNKGYSKSRGQGKAGRWMTNNEDIAPHIRSYEVDGLEPDHTYRFRIAAVYSNNDNKLGPDSAKFFLHRGSHLKTAPTLIHTQAESSTVIQIFWEFPSSRVHVDGFYIYYRATSSAGDYIKATVEGQATRSYNITHLLPGTAYDIKLQSFTTAGASDFSSILTQKTLSEPTEKPEVPEVMPNDIPISKSSDQQLYIVLGAVIGGLLLVIVIVSVVVYCSRHRSGSSGAPPEEHEQQDKSNGANLQIEAVNLFGMNNKIVRNGHTSQNGYIPTNKINITNNPLSDAESDKIHTAMEMSYLSSNNNCPSTSEAGGSAGDSNHVIDKELNSAAKCWRTTEPSIGEKYL